ncbi:serine/threonine protein kinase [Fusarium oxysporum f. sp. raphani 54005]|uniref:Serine/threonine protein kinase n=3 Tax=Fusarium TaxID=5506 RepID=X0BD77_FUSOX|nr:serine/threonine protein kinase [Fusarium oxysporum f. sp. raphani 54005]KAF4443609.1 serine/threonine protein kinase [Fusarium austroafricanum]KAG7408968.1 Rhodopsin kinase [Fusarium oxysporum f. sp. raphani]
MSFLAWFSEAWCTISGLISARSHGAPGHHPKGENPTTPEREVVEYKFYYPPGVRRVLACGTSAFIGEVDESTILKYPMEPGGDMTRLELEDKILTIVGRHPRVIGHKGLTAAGLYLDRATNGTVLEYLTDSNPGFSLQQRVTWCRQITEAVDHIHTKRVIHCDIQPTNILVDDNLNLKLTDFQGRHLSEHGNIILDGWSSEPCRYFCPREDEFDATYKTDLFALGSTIYFIMTGQEPFPDIVYGEVGWNERVKERFSQGIFPEDPHACSDITRKCWKQQYDSAKQVLENICSVENGLAREA